MFTAHWYFRIAPDRLRIDTDGITPGFDDRATVAIRADKIEAIGQKAEDLDGVADVRVVRPFYHPRIPVHDYVVASKLLQHGTRALMLRRRWSDVRLASKAIIHPLHTLEGGLTSVEERVFLELAGEVGARVAVVHTGRELTMNEVLAYDFTKAKQAFERTGFAFGSARR